MEPSQSNSSFIDPLQVSSSLSSLHVQTEVPSPLTNTTSHAQLDRSSPSSASFSSLPQVSTLKSTADSPLSPLSNEKIRWYHTPSYTFTIQITGMRWVGSHLMFRFQGETDLSCYPSSKIDGERTFQDFETLSSHLQKYNPFNILPGLPPSPINTDQTSRQSMERFLKRLIMHPLLIRDPSLISFLTSPAAFQPLISSNSEDLLPNPSWSFKLKAFVGSKPKDVDLHLEQAKQKTAEQVYCLKAFQKLIEKLGSTHKSLASAYLDFSTKLQGISVAETDTVLSTRWKDFSKKMQTAAQSYTDQAATEAYIMKHGLVMAVNSCHNYQHALDNRFYALTLYDDACRETEKQKRWMERLKASQQSLTNEKVTTSVQKLEHKHHIESKYRRQFKLASEYILRDQVQVQLHWVDELHCLLLHWSGTQFEFNKKLVSDVWCKDVFTDN